MLKKLQSAKKSIVNILEYPSYNKYIVEQAMLADEFITNAIVIEKARIKADKAINKVTQKSNVKLSLTEQIEQQLGMS